MGGRAMDLKIAARSLLRRPVFTGVAVATLALSIGAVTLVFSVVDGVLRSPLPYERPDELVTVYLSSDEWRGSDNEALRRAWDVQTMTLAHAERFRETPGPLAGAGAYTYRALPMEVGEATPESVEAIFTDPALFGVLGVEPSLGRLPTEDELRTGAPVAVLRHETWSSRFGGDPEVLGRSFRLGDRTHTVIGVMPSGFFFPTEDGGDLWTPVPTEARDWPSFYGIARLAPGAAVAEATDFLERVTRRLGEEDASKAGLGGRAVPHLDNVVGSVSGGIRLLFATALLVVLVACVNLGNLFLARTAGRRQELAVRTSLGAGTGSISSTVLAEVGLIGLVGGGLGIALASGALPPFVEALATSVRGLPRRGAIGLDATVLFFSVAVTTVTLVLAGLAPALVSARRAPADALGGVRRSGASDATRRGQRLLLAVQGTLTVVLVSAAALLGRSFLAAVSVDLGMETDRVAVIQLDVDMERHAEPGAPELLRRELRSRVSAVPGVSAVGSTTSLPGQGGVLLLPVWREGGEPERGAPVTAVSAGTGYFESMGIPLLAGRGFQPEDESSTMRTAVVSESLAMRLFGRSDVVGSRLLIDAGGAQGHELEIVGVAGETRQLSLFQPPAPTLYHPPRQGPSGRLYLTIAADRNPDAVLEGALDAVAPLPGGVELRRAATLPVMLREGVRHVRLRMILMAALAGLAGVLAMIGISGVVAHFLSEQTRDVGIRMALGAAARREVGRVVRYALWPTLLGLGVGLVLAVAASGVMESFLFGIEPTDPLTYAAVCVLLLGSAGLSAWIPARRTAAVDPARVLSGEG